MLIDFIRSYLIIWEMTKKKIKSVRSTGGSIVEVEGICSSLPSFSTWHEPNLSLSLKPQIKAPCMD